MKQFVVINTAWSLDDSSALHCPICGFDYNHITSVRSERSPSADEAPSPYEGTTMIEDPRNFGRRAAVRIDIEGECGHRWSLLIQQHKGTLYLYSRRESYLKLIKPDHAPTP